MIFAALRSVLRPSVIVMSSRSSDNNNGNGRVGRDTEKLKAAVKRLRDTSKEKRERLTKELQNSVDNIDRIAREEVEFLKALFEDESVNSGDSFDEIEGIVIFRDDE